MSASDIEPTVAARDLVVGDVVHLGPNTAGRAVTAVGTERGLVSVTFDHSDVPLLYPPDTRFTVAAPRGEGGPDTVAARYLIAGMHILGHSDSGAVPVYSVLHVHRYADVYGEHVAVTLLRLRGGTPRLGTYKAEDRITVATPEQVDEATAEGQREQLADALEDLVRDIRQQRLPVGECRRRMVALLPDPVGLTYERDDSPPETTAVAADHWQPTGRPVSAPPAGGAL